MVYKLGGRGHQEQGYMTLTSADLVVLGQGEPVSAVESCRQPDTTLAQPCTGAWLLGDRVRVLLSSHPLFTPHTSFGGSLAGRFVVLKPFLEIKTTTAVK